MKKDNKIIGLTLSDIVADEAFQMRVKLDMEHVETLGIDIQKRVSEGLCPLSRPIAVGKLENKHKILDGFHRYQALIEMDYQGEIDAELIDLDNPNDSPFEVALDYSIKANKEHLSLPRNAEDKLKGATTFADNKAGNYLKQNTSIILDKGVNPRILDAYSREERHKLICWKVPPKLVVSSCNVSQRTAERAVSEANANLKLKRDDWIQKLGNDEVSHSEIARKLNIDKKTVGRVIGAAEENPPLAENPRAEENGEKPPVQHVATTPKKPNVKRLSKSILSSFNSEETDIDTHLRVTFSELLDTLKTETEVDMEKLLKSLAEEIAA